MEIQIFENEQFGQLRGMTIEGEPWFVGKDVAQVLGYKDASKAVCDRVDKEDKTTLPIQQCGSNYKSQTTFINESGLYSLILSSKLPKAREFKRWVTAEVLPQIRRTGGYIVHYHLPIYNVPFVRIILLQKEMQPTFGLLPHHHPETPCVWEGVSVSVLFLAGFILFGSDIKLYTLFSDSHSSYRKSVNQCSCRIENQRS